MEMKPLHKHDSCSQIRRPYCGLFIGRDISFVEPQVSFPEHQDS
jgi:hypothetical protein